MRGWAWLVCLVLVLVVWLVQLIIYLAADNYAHSLGAAMEGCAWILTLYVVARAIESTGQAFGRGQSRSPEAKDTD